MEGFIPMKTPIHASNPLSRDETSKPEYQMIYKVMIHSLLYLTARDLILCIVYVYVLDFSLILESHILKLLRGYYAI